MTTGTLSQKHRRFVAEYLLDLNATQAAIRAGYSACNADVTGPRLLGNVGIAAAISVAQAARAERAEVDAEWVLRRLAEEADADLADLYDGSGALKPIQLWPLVWRKGLVAGIDVEEIRVEGIVVGVVRKVKLSDRVKRLELIGKHLGMFIERREVTGKDGGPIAHAVDVRNFTDDELMAVIRQAKPEQIEERS